MKNILRGLAAYVYCIALMMPAEWIAQYLGGLGSHEPKHDAQLPLTLLLVIVALIWPFFGAFGLRKFATKYLG